MARSQQKRSTNETCSLFFNGKGSPLPEHISKDDIRKHFSEFESNIKRVVLFRSSSKKSEGKGFIEFSSVEVAKNALSKLRGCKLNDSIPLFLNYFRKGGPKKAQPYGSEKSDQTTTREETQLHGTEKSKRREKTQVYSSEKSDRATIREKKHWNTAVTKRVKPECYVLLVSPQKGHFSDDVTEEKLRNHFTSLLGKEGTRATIARDKQTNRLLGFYYVEYDSRSAAIEAKFKLKGSIFMKYHLYIQFESPSTLRYLESRPLQCSPEHSMYLSHYLFNKASDEAHSFRAKLPAEVIDIGESLLLCGSDDDIRSSERIIKESVLSILSHISVPFRFHSDYASLLENDQLVTSSEEANVTCIVQKKVSTTGDDKLVVDVHLFGPRMLKERADEFKVLTPLSKTFSLHPESKTLSSMVADYIRASSKKYKTLAMKQGPQSVLIRGLRSKDVEDTWKDIKSSVDNTVVTRTIPITCYELKCIRSRQATIKDIETNCEIEFPVFQQSSTSLSEETLEITVKAKVSDIKRTTDKFTKAISKCTVEQVQLYCPKKHIPSWSKRWDKLVKDQQAENHVHIEYDCQKSVVNGEGDTCSVSFLLCGDNAKAVNEAKNVVINRENGKAFTEHDISLSAKQCEYIQRNVQSITDDLEQSLQICLEVETCSHTQKITLLLSSHLDAEQLEKLEDSLFSCLRNVTTKKLTFVDKVAGQILLRDNLSAIKSLRDHSTVSFTLDQVHVTLEIQGPTTDVDDAEVQIEKELKHVSTSITQLCLEKTSLPVLSSPPIASLVASLEKEHGVSCHYPTIEKQKRVLGQKCFKTSTGQILTIQLCNGNILQEDADAIIVPVISQLKTPLTSNIPDLAGMKVRESQCSELVTVKDLPSTNETTVHTLSVKSVVQVVVDTKRPRSCQTLSTALSAVYARSYRIISIPCVDTMTISQYWVEGVLASIHTHATVHPDTTLCMVRVVIPLTNTTKNLTSVFENFSYDKIVAKKAQEIPARSTPSDTTQKTSGMKWYWDDHGSFAEYDQDVSDQISAAWMSDNKGMCHVIVNDNYYQINFSKMTQTNQSTEFDRQIKCVATPPVPAKTFPKASKAVSDSVQWNFKDDSGIYQPYSADNSRELEDMYQVRIPVTTLSINQWEYAFDFDDMVQINIKTQRKRKLKRKEVRSPATSTSSVKPPLKSLQILDPNEMVVLNIRGSKQHVLIARTQIKETVDSLIVSKDIPIPPQLSIDRGFYQRLEAIVKKFKYIIYTIKEAESTPNKTNTSNLSRKLIQIEGDEQLVDQAQDEVNSEISKLSSEAEGGIHYPKEWELQKETFEMFEVKRMSDEWKKLSSRFKKTMVNAQIVKIRRVQNKWLWEKYQQDRIRLHKKNGGMVNEQELFHGSRSTCADDIVNSEEGFDMRFSSKGMWGQANYFAQDASYSDKYAYEQNGVKEMFVARVLTGNSYTSASDSDLRMPPLKESAPNSKVKLNKVRYDTVNGVTCGTKVYMTYSNEKAYPAYVLEYCVQAYSSSSQGYLYPRTTAPSGASYTKPTPTAPSGASYTKPTPTAPSGASYTRPTPTASSGASYTRPTPTASSGASYTRPTPTASYGGPEGSTWFSAN